MSVRAERIAQPRSRDRSTSRERAGATVVDHVGYWLGESMTGQHAQVVSMFSYVAATILVIALVRVMPPYRSQRWLSGARAAGDERSHEHT